MSDAAANRAMRKYVFDPAGYPEDGPVTIASGELDHLVVPPEGGGGAPAANVP